MVSRLHLGCGTRYLEGYTNIDYPSNEHTVQSGLVADLYADIRQLQFSKDSIDEVRLHHVFEHFPRQIAIALLCRWTDWLKPGGMLHIETPDVMASAWALVSPLASYKERQQIIRHLFGSHEASWAAHWDGWYDERFRHTLSMLGYRNIRLKKSRWESLRNIEVFATRGDLMFSIPDYRRIAMSLLSDSLITYGSTGNARKPVVSDSEQVMLDVWMREWESAYIVENG